MGFDRCLLHLVDPARLFEHMRSGGEAVGDVAGLRLDVVNQVVGGIVRPLHIRFVVNHGRSVEDGLVLVEHCGEHLVGHVDQVDRCERDLFRVGCDGCDAIADETDPIVEADLVVGEWVGVALATRRISHSRHVPVMEYGVDAGERRGSRVVDVNDPCVRVRAVEHLRHEGAGGNDVVGEGRIALHQLDGIDLDLGVADDTGVRHVDAWNDLWSDRGQGGHILVGRGAARERIEEGDVNALGIVPADHRGRPQDGVDWTQIAGLAVKDAREGIPDVVFGRVRIRGDQGLCSEDHCRRGVPGLDCAGLDECFLNRVEVAGAAHALNGLDLVAIGLSCQHQVGGDEDAVYEHGRRSGLSALRAESHAVVPGPAQHGT